MLAALALVMTAAGGPAPPTATPPAAAPAVRGVVPSDHGEASRRFGPQDTTGVYRTLLMRAAPGRLQELLDALTARLPAYGTAGVERPLIMRHSQGDHWDLMLVFPIESVADWYGERGERWRRDAPSHATEAAFETTLEPLVAWREETFVTGPAHAALRARDAGAGLYHIEMFIALADRRRELVHQRYIENDFLDAIGRRGNAVFQRLGGAAWDVYTIGFYRDLQHYAEPAAATMEEQEAAARAAGFASRGSIGTYLRELIASHHDTLATRVH